jgi:hypothetical protein
VIGTHVVIRCDYPSCPGIVVGPPVRGAISVATMDALRTRAAGEGWARVPTTNTESGRDYCPRHHQAAREEGGK